MPLHLYRLLSLCMARTQIRLRAGVDSKIELVFLGRHSAHKCGSFPNRNWCSLRHQGFARKFRWRPCCHWSGQRVYDGHCHNRGGVLITLTRSGAAEEHGGFRSLFWLWTRLGKGSYHLRSFSQVLYRSIEPDESVARCSKKHRLFHMLNCRRRWDFRPVDEHNKFLEEVFRKWHISLSLFDCQWALVIPYKTNVYVNDFHITNKLIGHDWLCAWVCVDVCIRICQMTVW